MEQRGELAMFEKDTLRAQVDLQWPAIGVSIWAHGDRAAGEWPELQVRLGGTVVADFPVDSGEEKEYFFPAWAGLGMGSPDLMLLLYCVFLSGKSASMP